MAKKRAKSSQAKANEAPVSTVKSQSSSTSNSNKKSPVVFFGIIILIVGGILLYLSIGSASGEYDEFSVCIAENGAKFYGAWWCPHCAEQKKLFGNSFKTFEKAGGYIECSNADRTQNGVCTEAGITGYPTWRFGDGSELSGRVSLLTLAQKTGCQI